MLLFLHGRLALMSLIYFVILTAWGYFRFFRKQGIDSSYWGGLAIGEILISAQSIIGFLMWFGGQAPAKSVHILYGILAPALIPLVYVYTKGGDDRPDALVYGTATLFAAAFVIRAFYTGGL